MNKAVSSTELNMNELVNCIMKQLEEKDYSQPHRDNQ